MKYLIAGTATFASQANRDAAKTRIDTALAGYSYTSVSTVFTPGVSMPNATTITFSLSAGSDEAVAKSLFTDAYNALTSTNRFTAGYLSMNGIP